MYRDGRGVDKDEVRAVNWYRLAAEQGYSDAQVNLGLMYEEGLGVLKDEMEAISWYCRAAEQGDSDGQMETILMSILHPLQPVNYCFASVPLL